jgi:hypothetical protein
MSSSTTSNYSKFIILVKKGTTSGSTQPSPGGSGQLAAVISASASSSVTVGFTIESTKTDTNPLSEEQQQDFYVNPPLQVFDYTLTAITTEPVPTDVTIFGAVGYQPAE